jgi:hypothetical protein
MHTAIPLWNTEQYCGIILPTVGKFSLDKRKSSDLWPVHNPEPQVEIYKACSKKRPNFLNNEPTSIESALRPMSAPRVRFWQQIAICPVSLCALVVELHPLNWARAQLCVGLVTKWQWKSLKNNVCVCVCVCVCVWNFAANLVNILQRHFNCLTKHTGRTVWAERSAMSGFPESPLWF